MITKSKVYFRELRLFMYKMKPNYRSFANFYSDVLFKKVVTLKFQTALSQSIFKTESKQKNLLSPRIKA